MLKKFNPTKEHKSLESIALKAFEASPDQNEVTKRLRNILYNYLCKAAELEHLLSMQYLFSAFSTKKYPEEFSQYNSQSGNDLEVIKTVEIIRRWEAKVLYVSRQEMEHLNLVQNLIAILEEKPFFYHPNFPVSASENPLGHPIELVPFNKYAIEVFRYWEKPDHISLPFPTKKGAKLAVNSKQSEGAVDANKFVQECWDEIISLIKNEPLKDPIAKNSIEELYTCINLYFLFLLKYKIIDGGSINKIVEEHFGFNITLEPIVEGKYLEYVNDVIDQILTEGEGVVGVPPSLESHFMVFQDILDELGEMEKPDALGSDYSPCLPVVENPIPDPLYGSDLDMYLSASSENLQTNPITNEVGIKAMELFNDAYMLLNQMLYWYFNDYSIDYTTGIRPPKTNAFFRTSFYPFMTMVIRPLGEMVCRLPADRDYQPVPGKVPLRTAGPNFFFAIPYQESIEKIMSAFEEANDMEYFTCRLNKMAEKADGIGRMCKEMGYHMANFQSDDARDFDVRFRYLYENFHRIAQNFECYWKGEIIAPIPSKNFQNFNDQYN